MLDMIDRALSALAGAVRDICGTLSGTVLAVMILSAGVCLSARSRFVQVRFLKRAAACVLRGEKGERGEVSAFSALCTSLAATVGTGNIVGVATAVAAGGPGALLWMLTAAFFGMATKYAEGLLAVKYRVESRPGRFLGGPFLYIERGLGRRFIWLSRAFALSGAAAGLFGIGTLTQSGSIASAVEGMLADSPLTENGALCAGASGLSPAAVISGVITAALAALVLIGGSKRITKVCGAVVPVMAGAYLILTLIILIANRERIPAALRTIAVSAFEPSAAKGAIRGLTLGEVVRAGVGRGVFSNEAGLGSAPIAAAAAKTREPARQGLVSMLGVFIDTFVVCAATGLAIVVTGAWDPSVTGRALNGFEITGYAWRNGLPFGGSFASAAPAICLIVFAFTTIIGWNFYGERCLEYLCASARDRGGCTARACRVYRILYMIAVACGPLLSVAQVWGLADLFNSLMAIPNLVALFLLSPVVAKETARFTARIKSEPPPR